MRTRAVDIVSSLLIKLFIRKGKIYMKIGAQLVEAIQPMAGLLSQSLDQHSQFYQFLESNPQHKTFLQRLTKEMQFALRFGGNGRFEDKNGLTKNLFGEYLEAIIELNAGNPTRLIELFQHPIAKSIVRVFNHHLIALTALNDEFVAFEKRLQAPSVSVAATSNHASTSTPTDAFGDLIDSFSGKRIGDLPLDQSIYVPSTSSHAKTSSSAQAFGDLIDSLSGKRIGDLPLDQSIYIQSTSSSAKTSDPIKEMVDLIDLYSGKRIGDLRPDQSMYVPSTSSRTFAPAHMSELQRAKSITPGYRLEDKYGQPVSELDCSKSIRMIPVRN